MQMIKDIVTVVLAAFAASLIAAALAGLILLVGIAW